LEPTAALETILVFFFSRLTSEIIVVLNQVPASVWDRKPSETISAKRSGIAALMEDTGLMFLIRLATEETRHVDMPRLQPSEQALVTIGNEHVIELKPSLGMILAMAVRAKVH